MVLDEVVGADARCPTEPSALVEGDEAGREACESLVDVGTSVVADGKALEAVEPGLGIAPLPIGDDQVSRCSRCLFARCAAQSRASGIRADGVWHRRTCRRAACPGGIAVARAGCSAGAGRHRGWPTS